MRRWSPIDGPVCNVFATYKASAIAADLRGLPSDEVIDLPGTVMETTDPLEVLRWTGLNRPDLVPAVEDALRAAELSAVTGAIPTPYAREVMMATKRTGRPVAIVSNNSAPAIEAYIGTHRLGDYVSFVIGREPYHPERMKPDPCSVETALKRFDSQPLSALLVGDSMADIKASHLAGVSVIAFANKPSKLAGFRMAGANAVVTSMAEVAMAIELTGWV